MKTHLYKILCLLPINFIVVFSLLSQPLSIAELHNNVFTSDDIGDISNFLHAKGFEYESSNKKEGVKSVYFSLSSEYIVVHFNKREEEEYVSSVGYSTNKDNYYNILKEIGDHPSFEKFKNYISDEGLLTQTFVNTELRVKYIFENGKYEGENIYFIVINVLLYTDYSEFMKMKGKSNN